MTGQPPRLTPSAAPVDPFVRPGVPGPKTSVANFEALAQLSGTLRQFASAQDERQFQAAQQIGPEVAKAVPRTLFPVLNGGDEVTAGHLQDLDKAGIHGIDNPYAIMALRQATAVQQVRDAGINSWFSDPKWFDPTIRTAVDNPEAAEAAKQERISQFVEKLPPMGEVAKAAAQQEVLRHVERFEAARDKAKLQVFSELKDREVATFLGTAFESFRERILGTKDPEQRKAGLEWGANWAQQYIKDSKLTIGEAAAEESFVRALEPTLMAVVREDSDFALHFLDGIRDSWDTPSPDLHTKFDQLATKVERAIEQHQAAGTRNLESSMRIAKSRIDRIVAETTDPQPEAYWRERLFKGDLNQVILDTFAENGTNPELAGDLRTMLVERVRENTHAARSDQVELEKIMRMIHAGKVEEADTYLDTLTGATITTQDRRALYEDMERQRGRGAHSERAKSARSSSFGAVVRPLGNLADEATELVSQIEFAHNAAFNEVIDADPLAFEKAQAAGRAAVVSSPIFKQIEELQVAGTFEFLQDTTEYQRDIASPIAASAKIEWEQLVAASQEGEPPSNESFLNKRAIYDSNVNRYMEARHAQLKEEYKNLPASQRNRKILNTMRSEVGRALEYAKGLSDAAQQAQAGKEFFAAPAAATSDTQISRMTKMGPLSLVNVPELAVPSTVDDGILWDGPYTSSMLLMRDQLLRLQTGGSLDQPGMDRAVFDMELAISAMMKDGVSPMTAGEAGDNRLGDLIRAAPRSSDAQRNVMYTVLLNRGLLPQEIVDGKTRFDVDLQAVFGSKGRNWAENLPLQQIALFESEAAVQEARKELKVSPEGFLSLMFRRLGIDPTDDKATGQVFDWQLKLVKGRTVSKDATGGPGYRMQSPGLRIPTVDPEGMSRTLLRGAPEFKDAPPWAQKRIAAMKSFMEGLK